MSRSLDYDLLLIQYFKKFPGGYMEVVEFILINHKSCIIERNQ